MELVNLKEWIKEARRTGLLDWDELQEAVARDVVSCSSLRKVVLKYLLNFLYGEASGGVFEREVADALSSGEAARSDVGDGIVVVEWEGVLYYWDELCGGYRSWVLPRDVPKVEGYDVSHDFRR